MIIGISGKMGVGKNLFAELLKKRIQTAHPKLRVMEVSFAEPLKEAVSILFDCEDAPWTQEGKKKVFLIEKEKSISVTCRSVLQDLGTWIRDHYGEEFWVNRLFSKWDGGKNGEIWIISDVRYPNEVERINYLGGFIIRIESPYIIDCDGKEETLHPSEVSLDERKNTRQVFDVVIMNDRSLGIEVLKNNIERVFLLWEEHFQRNNNKI